jgi:hypothetical protein
LSQYSPLARESIIAGFVQLTRNGYFQAPRRGQQFISEGTCRAAIDTVAAAFTDANLPDPTRNPYNNKRTMWLDRQLRDYKNTDPGIHHQQSIPFQVIKDMVRRPASNATAAVFHQLVLLAFFFALRSCEYLKVCKQDNYTQPRRRTKPLSPSSFTFWKNHRVMDHRDENLDYADCVSILFEFQKKQDRNNIVTQHRTGHPIFCPVRAAAATIRRMNKLIDKGKATPKTYIYAFETESGDMAELTGKIALLLLREFIQSIDYKSLGLVIASIGLHSLRSASAMAMFLNGIPPYLVMMIGRWSSECFIRYVRKATEQFGHDVSKIMIKNPTFHHVLVDKKNDPRLPMASVNHFMALHGAQPPLTSYEVWSQ